MDSGSAGLRTAPPQTADCAPDFPAPSVAPTDWTVDVRQTDGARIVDGASIEVMLDADGRHVIPLSTTIDREGFSCWKITSEVETADGERLTTPPYQALSDRAGATLLWHVRVGDLVDREATVTFEVQGNSTELYRWSRQVRLVGPSG